MLPALSLVTEPCDAVEFMRDAMRDPMRDPIRESIREPMRESMRDGPLLTLW